MATTFFPRSTNTSGANYSGDPGGYSSNDANSTNPLDLLLTRGAAASLLANTASPGVSQAAGTRTQPQRGTSVPATYFTKPLNAVTISGSISVTVRGLEDNAMANCGLGMSIHLVDAVGAWISVIGRGFSATELGTTEAARSFTITPTSTAVSAGQRIAVLLDQYAAGGSTSSGFFVACVIDGPTSGASGDTFVRFTETITEHTAAKSLVYAERRVARNSLLRRHHEPREDRFDEFMETLAPGWQRRESGILAPAYA